MGGPEAENRRVASTRSRFQDDGEWLPVHPLPSTTLRPWSALRTVYSGSSRTPAWGWPQPRTAAVGQSRMGLAMPLGLETMDLMVLWDHEPLIQPAPCNGGLGFRNRVCVELCTSTIGPGYIALGGAEVKARASRAHRGSVRIFKLGRVTPCLALWSLTSLRAERQNPSFLLEPVRSLSHSAGAFLILLNVQAPLGAGKRQLMYTASAMERPGYLRQESLLKVCL